MKPESRVHKALDARLRETIFEVASDQGIEDPTGGFRIEARRMGSVTYVVESASRGWVEVGWQTAEQIKADRYEALVLLAQELEEKVDGRTTPATDGNRAKGDRQARVAQRLKRQRKMSNREIADEMGITERWVNELLKRPIDR